MRLCWHERQDRASETLKRRAKVRASTAAQQEIFVTGSHGSRRFAAEGASPGVVLAARPFSCNMMRVEIVSTVMSEKTGVTDALVEESLRDSVRIGGVAGPILLVVGAVLAVTGAIGVAGAHNNSMLGIDANGSLIFGVISLLGGLVFWYNRHKALRVQKRASANQ